jgi:type IV secretory pathway TrbF-like protein
MPPDAPPGRTRRARRVALLIALATLALAAAGALWFVRSASQAQRDPGLVYRDRATLDQLLKRAEEAERAGDRATAIATYRFVAAVAGARGAGADIAPYVAAARAGLTRLGAADTLPGPPR